MATVIKKKTVSLFPEAAPRKKDRGKTFVINIYVLIFFLALAVIGISFLYLSEFNKISSQGVIINDLETDRAKLIIENEVWNMRIARLKSMDVIQQQDVVKRMITIDPAEIEFIDVDKLEDIQS